jgi:hypothetical protein
MPAQYLARFRPAPPGTRTRHVRAMKRRRRMADEHTDLARVLGRIEGKLDMIVTSQHVQSERLDAMDSRLRQVETQAAKAGALTGGLVAVLTAIVVEWVKRLS